MIDDDQGDLVGGGELDHAVGHLQSMAGCRGTHETKEARAGDRDVAGSGDGRVGKVQCAQRAPEGHQTNEHAEVADSVDDKCFVGSR